MPGSGTPTKRRCDTEASNIKAPGWEKWGLSLANPQTILILIINFSVTQEAPKSKQTSLRDLEATQNMINGLLWQYFF